MSLVSVAGSYRGGIGGRAAATCSQFYLQSYPGDTITSHRTDHRFTLHDVDISGYIHILDL